MAERPLEPTQHVAELAKRPFILEVPDQVERDQNEPLVESREVEQSGRRVGRVWNRLWVGNHAVAKSLAHRPQPEARAGEIVSELERRLADKAKCVVFLVCHNGDTGM